MTYVFTFGFDHQHPRYAQSLGKSYIEIPGDIEQSRRLMLFLFGRDWAFQYPDKESAKVDRYNLKPIREMRVVEDHGFTNCGCLSVRVEYDWLVETNLVMIHNEDCVEYTAQLDVS